MASDFDGIDDDLDRFQEDAHVKDALGRGVDLREYSRQLEHDLKQVEEESVDTYVREAHSVVALHEQMNACDVVLERMQLMLGGFREDLGGISDEIKSLQDQSITMSVKVRNRKTTEERLSLFLEKIVVPEELVAGVTEAEVNTAYTAWLLQLNDKLTYSQRTTPPPDGSCGPGLAPCDTRAVADVRATLERLRLKAVAKVRQFLVKHILELKKPKTNLQMVQTNVLLKYAEHVRFLAEQDPPVAAELKTLYADTVGRALHALFRGYHASLLKLQAELATKNDLVAVEETTPMRGLFSSSKVDLTKHLSPLALGNRDGILGQVEAPAIIVHLAQAEGASFPYEALFRSVLKHLTDSATSEYLFAKDFFRGAARPSEMFNVVFARTLSLCLESVENHLFGCHDAVGLLLMLRLTQAYRSLMRGRRVAALDPFFDRLELLLWPRFKAVFDANIASLRGARVARMGAVASAKSHFVVRRYGEFAAAVLSLHRSSDGPEGGARGSAGGAASVGVVGGGEGARGGEGGVGGGAADQMVLQVLATLREELVLLLGRLADRDPRANRKSRMVFLVNNYHAVLAVFTARRITSDETARFEELLAQQREAFVEEELRQPFGRLIAFVQQTEAQLSAAGPGGPAGVAGAIVVDQEAAGVLAREFASTWKRGIELINADVGKLFEDVHNGTELLKQVLTQLLLYYTRFQVREGASGRAAACRAPVHARLALACSC